VDASSRFSSPWEGADFGPKTPLTATPHTITGVNLYNRMDCCSERLQNVAVEHFNVNTFSWVTDFTHTASTLGVPKLSLSFDAVSAEHVRIRKTDFEFLSLAEVQVLGF
jgi:hypothetical protein